MYVQLKVCTLTNGGTSLCNEMVRQKVPSMRGCLAPSRKHNYCAYNTAHLLSLGGWRTGGDTKYLWRAIRSLIFHWYKKCPTAKCSHTRKVQNLFQPQTKWWCYCKLYTVPCNVTCSSILSICSYHKLELSWSWWYETVSILYKKINYVSQVSLAKDYKHKRMDML